MKFYGLLITVIVLYVGLITYAFLGGKPDTARTEQLQQRERTAVGFCLDNGGTAQFSYEQGADHLTFIGCSFTRGQSQASGTDIRIPGGKTS